MPTKVKCCIAGCLKRPARGCDKEELRFCKEHYEMYDVEWVKCNGQAHQPGVDQDHCMVCMPHWAKYPVPVLKETTHV